jgi:membrane-associated protease RseP (regulator of RpoE activity)
MEILNFLLQYKYIIVFYTIIAVWIAAHWNKFDVQAKIIFLYRTKLGLKTMDKMVKKYREQIILLGYIGVGAGFVGLVFISYTLISNLWSLIFNPSVGNAVSLVLPGVNVPGLGVLPFWYWLISIFIIATVHEFGHGIVARAHKIPVLSSGFVLFGPIIGAFVEPDEKKMSAESDINQYSVMAAGPFSNILLAILAVALLSWAVQPGLDLMVEPTGFTFETYTGDDLAAAMAGLPAETIITNVNGVEYLEFQPFQLALSCMSPGDMLNITADNIVYPVLLGSNPEMPGKPLIGIDGISNNYELKPQFQGGLSEIGYNVLEWFSGLLRWLFILSLGIGLFNLLPLPIVDGGRMVQVSMRKMHGQKKGDHKYGQIALFFLIVLILNVFYPLLTRIFI